MALCYSLYTFEHDKSDIFCKMMAVTVFNPKTAEITVITEGTMVNEDSSGNHLHEHPMISSQNILRDNVCDSMSFPCQYPREREKTDGHHLKGFGSDECEWDETS